MQTVKLQWFNTVTLVTVRIVGMHYSTSFQASQKISRASCLLASKTLPSWWVPTDYSWMQPRLKSCGAAHSISSINCQVSHFSSAAAPSVHHLSFKTWRMDWQWLDHVHAHHQGHGQLLHFATTTVDGSKWQTEKQTSIGTKIQRTCYSPDHPANKFWISLFAGWKLCRMWLGARFSVHASVYLQHTLTPPKVPNPFCSQVPLRSFARRAVSGPCFAWL